MEFDHPGERSPEKDWWQWLAFQQLEQKPSSESSDSPSQVVETLVTANSPS